MNHQTATLFTHSQCPDSPKVRAWLVQHGIPFRERALDDEDDPEAVAALQATGSFVTPLLLAGDNSLIGYRPERLRTMFNID